MQVGPYKLSAMETGEFALDGGAMFGIIPKTLWERRIPSDEKNRIGLRLRAMLIQGKGRNILVDTGIGEKGDEKFENIYKVNHARFSMERSLAEHTLRPPDITDVVITHLHFDHAGGATMVDERGKIVPTFSNAVYYIQEKQLKWALSATEKERASFRKEDFTPLMDRGSVKLLSGPCELYPGIFVRVSYGHTEAQQHVLVTDGEAALFYCADMIPTSVHVGLQWIMGYDVRPLDTLKEKKEVLKEAAANDWVLFFEHCPHISAAKIEEDGEGSGGYRISEADAQI